ncbi:GumC family protein [Dyadobacter subterraneus]|uniref:Polysaccharide biosynthesis tyrosine autokinase n=1 Tax=Dyadobacter subterraneus TaxID=2773304 RepID=A0ABR9WLJ0_9BACT|nr:tyrosine-protein kinase [Dyadobacter subterraneus]MBE9466388.1 polysaccharide biosynthesis tyrosine autokinase [Dyadobacter subterraneus]
MTKGNEGAFFEEFLNHSDSLDFQKVFKVILSRWYWVAGSLFLFGISCFLFLKLVKPKYVASINLKYLDKQTELDEITSTKPTYLINDGSNEYLTEKYNIQSQEVVENALINLKYPFTFYRLKDFRRIDIYPYQPLSVKVISFDELKFEKGKFSIDPELNFSYQTENDYKTFKLIKGAICSVPGLSFQIELININEKFNFEFDYNNPSTLARDFIKRIEVSEIEDQMPVLTVSFKHHNKPFAKNFLEMLLESYLTYDLRQKQQSSDLTLQFIDNQLRLYSKTLKDAAHKLEIFKQKNTVFDVSTSAVGISEKTRDIEQRKNESEIQKAYIKALEKNLGNTFESVNYLSVGLDGTTDAVLIGLLEQFNSLISKRKELLIKYSYNAPAVKNLDEELVKSRRQILDNIKLQQQKNSGTIRILDQNLASLQKQFRQIPALEKNLLYLQSDFEVNKNIYSLLLNKQIESSIVRAGMLPSFRIITLMKVEKIFPKPVQIITLSLFLSLLTGVSSIFIIRYFNKTFVDIDLPKSGKNIHLLGLIHHFEQRKGKETSFDLNMLLTDQSIFTESISALRTRLSFLKSDEKLYPEKGKQILITSQQSGEGKTFVSINLALSLTKIRKKVIVIGCDLRKSKLHYFFGDLNEKGLSSYLQKKTDLKELIKSSIISNLDYIPAGAPPFNPAELLQLDLFQDLLSHCRKEYDYVFLDSAPVGLVSDNIPLLNQSHTVLFILRWLHSHKDAPRLAEKLAADYEIDKIEVVINDFYPDNLYNSISSSPSYTDQYGYDYQGNSYFNKNSNGKFANVKKKLGLQN